MHVAHHTRSHTGTRAESGGRTPGFAQRERAHLGVPRRASRDGGVALLRLAAGLPPALRGDLDSGIRGRRMLADGSVAAPRLLSLVLESCALT
jgi:hypothetical protein